MGQSAGGAGSKTWLGLGALAGIGCGCLLCGFLLASAYFLGDTIQEKLPGFASSTPSPSEPRTRTPIKQRTATRTFTPTPTQTPTKTIRPTLTQSVVYTPADTSTPAPTQTYDPNILLPRGPWQLYENNSDLWVGNPDGGAVTALDPQFLAAGMKGVSVAPKGGLVAWMEMKSEQEPQSLAIRVVEIPSLKTKALIPLVKGGVSGGQASKIQDILDHPAMTWSPDGDWLAFPALGEGASIDLFQHNITSGETIRLTDNLGQEFDPQWSPDGQKVVFFNSQVDKSQIEWVGTWMVDPVLLVKTPLYDPVSSQQIFMGWNDSQSFYVNHKNEICENYDLRRIDTHTTHSTQVFEGCYNAAAFDHESGNLLVTVDERLSASCPCARQPSAPGIFFLPQGQGLPQVIDSHPAYGVLYRPLARLFFTRSVQGYTSAYSTRGFLSPIPPSVVGLLPEVSSSSGLWAWGPPDQTDETSSIWLGAPGQTMQLIYNGSAHLPRWGMDGKSLIFLDDTRMFTSRFPDFTPTQNHTFPSPIKWIQTIWP